MIEAWKPCGRWVLAVGVVTALAGCKDDAADDDAAGTGTGTSTTADTEPDPTTPATGGTVDDTGAGSSGDTGDAIDWTFSPIYGLANVDDDDEDGTPDVEQSGVAGDDDLATLTVPAVPAGHSVRLQLEGDVDGVRIFDATGTQVLGADDIAPIDELELVDPGGPLSFDVEFVRDAIAVRATADLRDGAGTLVETATFELHASPIILAHHLQPTEEVFVMERDAPDDGNLAMVAALQAVLGDRLTVVPGPAYGNDRWMQDEFDFAFGTAPGGQTLMTIIDSIRDRELDPYPEDNYGGPGVSIRTWGDPGEAASEDSMGNVEVSPPVTVDGVEYPFGRIYYGAGLHPELVAQLSAQYLQDPIELDVDWLCVRHVSQMVSFVPDPASDKGFRMLVADPDLGRTVLEGMPFDLALPRYAADHGYAEVGDLLLDVGLAADNQEAAVYIEMARDTLVAELGLDASDVVGVPAVFDLSGGCGMYELAPSLVNLTVVNLDTGTHVFVSDPFMRTDLGDQGSDAFIAAFEAAMPASVTAHFLDSWDGYHLLFGDVHGGLAVRAAPPAANWWEVGLHLLPGG